MATMEELLATQDGTQVAETKVIKKKMSHGRTSAKKQRYGGDEHSHVWGESNNDAPIAGKIPRTVVKNTINVPNKPNETRRDPRFDDLSGPLDMDAWSQNYQFVKDKRKNEKKMLMKKIKPSKNKDKHIEAGKLLQRLNNQEVEQKRLASERQRKQQARKDIIESYKAGVAPKFKSKKTKILEEQASTFQEIKKGKRMEKYLKRKEKKLRNKELEF